MGKRICYLALVLCLAGGFAPSRGRRCEQQVPDGGGERLQPPVAATRVDVAQRGGGGHEVGGGVLLGALARR